MEFVLEELQVQHVFFWLVAMFTLCIRRESIVLSRMPFTTKKSVFCSINGVGKNKWIVRQGVEGD
jgi:hypothetical protein